MRRFLDWVMGVAEALGGPGLALLAFLDSSFLSFPQVVDVLMMGLAAKYPERLVWYAALPMIGSVAGSYLLYFVARRGGEAFVRRRVGERHMNRAFGVFRRYGLLAVAVPAILPPPVPFKLFVLAAGASGMRTRDFLIATAIGRSVRYFGEALLAAWFGATALARLELFVEENKALSGAIVVLAVGGIALWIWWSGRRTRFDSDAGSSL
ncbi:MAG TPA: VTT domain-containing protein [Vicinamibacterales bacterium]